MIFTLYYVYATLLQWWRLVALKNKLRGTLNTHNALLVCDESVIFDLRRTRSIENLLFRADNRIGVTIVPKQRINLGAQWLYFPKDSRYFPMYFKNIRPTIFTPYIYVLLEAVLLSYKKHEAEILPIENFGELLAWKVADQFEAILKTDMTHLTRLVHCFSQRDCDINHELQLLKIETIAVDGIAKRIVYERQYSTETSQKYSLAPLHWQKFVADVKELYSKIRDATNPKITIDNGTPKPEEVKIVPVSEVKPMKKDKKSDERNTLEVNCSDYRRHRGTEYSREHRSREHRKHRAKDEIDSSKHQKTSRDKDEKTEIAEFIEQEVEVIQREEVIVLTEPGFSSVEPVDVKTEAPSKEKKSGHRHREKHHHKRSEEKEKLVCDEPQPGTSGSSSQRPMEKLKKGSRTSSKEKKLVRASATCDEPTEGEKGQDKLDELAPITRNRFGSLAI